MRVATEEPKAGAAETRETAAFRKMLARVRSRPRPEMTSEEMDALIADERRAARKERDARRR